MVVDETAAYFGGMNFVDNVENVERQKQERRPASSGWRDVHVRLNGAQIVELAESFERSWKRAHGEEIEQRPKAYCRANMAAGNESIRFFDSGPGNRFSRAARVYSTLLAHAREAVYISMAYFIPVGKVFRAMARARKRRVRFRIVVPGKSDVKIVQHATRFLYRWLLRRGFRVYERQGRMLHSKLMVVDNQWTVVGSCNIDPRSLFTNLEFLCVVRSEKLARMMIEICQSEIAASRRIRGEECRQNWWQRLKNRFAWQLRWWL
jgi:cardiolipin synthase